MLCTRQPDLTFAANVAATAALRVCLAQVPTRDFQVAIHLIYEDVGSAGYYSNVAFNATIEVVEKPKLVDMEGIFMYIMIIGVLGGSGERAMGAGERGQGQVRLWLPVLLLRPSENLGRSRTAGLPASPRPGSSGGWRCDKAFKPFWWVNQAVTSGR